MQNYYPAMINLYNWVGNTRHIVKDSWKTNSADPDQTASGSVLFVLDFLAGNKC